VVSPAFYDQLPLFFGAYQSKLAELFQGVIHALLHDHEFLLLLFNNSSDIALLGVDLVQQIVDLCLFGLWFSFDRISSLTLKESSNSVNCLLYLDITLETSVLLCREASSARSFANERSRLIRSSSSLWDCGSVTNQSLDLQISCGPNHIARDLARGSCRRARGFSLLRPFPSVPFCRPLLAPNSL
jgi:hypothetical protein